MDEFLQDRQFEFETYAMIGYFKLLKQLELTKEEGFPVFNLIGGRETMTNLEEYAKNGYFDCRKTNGELLLSLSFHIKKLQEVTSVKTVFIEEAIYNSEVIKKFGTLVDFESTAYGTLSQSLENFPINEVSESFLLKIRNGSLHNENQKKIGQK